MTASLLLPGSNMVVMLMVTFLIWVLILLTSAGFSFCPLSSPTPVIIDYLALGMYLINSNTPYSLANMCCTYRALC